MELTDRYVAELPFAVGDAYAARDDLKGFFVAVGRRKRLLPFRAMCVTILAAVAQRKFRLGHSLN